MKLSKLVKILADLDERCSNHPDAVRLDIEEVKLHCTDDIVLTIIDKKLSKDSQ